MRAPVVVVCAALGAVAKVAVLGWSGFASAEPDAREEMRQLAASLSAAGLRIEAVEPVAQAGPYAALTAVSEGCNGALRLMPLYRNGEAVILAQVAADASGGVSSGFIVDGRIFDAYPALRHQFVLTRQKIRKKNRPGPPMATAFWEVGDCGLAHLATLAVR